MGARSDAGIFLRAPVDEIVAAFAAGARMVGNLIGRQAVRRADLLRRVVKGPRGILVGNFELARGMQRRERRVRLDGELIERQMLPGFAKRMRKLARPVPRRLLRPRIDQIERVAVENATRDGDGVERLARRMPAPEL